LEDRAELEVLAHGHLTKQPSVLGNDRHSAGDPLRYRPATDVLALEQDPAGAGPHQSEDRLERRRLA